MSSGLIVPVLLGVCGGIGVWLVITGMRPRPVPLRVLLAELEEPYQPVRATGVDSMLARLTASATGGVTKTLRQDLAVLDRTMADHAKAKLQNAFVLAVLPLAGYVAFTAGTGTFVSPALVGLAMVGAAAAGWVMTEPLTHQRAEQRRSEIRSALVTYLQLVSTMLAGGAGPNEALLAVTRFGSGPGFDEITAALKEAKLRGVTPWVVFAQVADRKGLVVFDELAAAVELAGTSGARVRSSLLTKAQSLRATELSEMEASAAAASESMGVPVGVMLLGFVLAVGFPALIAILQI